MMQAKVKQIAKLDVEAEEEEEELAALREDEELPLALHGGGVLSSPYAVRLEAVGFSYPAFAPLFRKTIEWPSFIGSF
jgi:hypothetical protein